MQIIYPVSIHFGDGAREKVQYRVDIVTDLCATVLQPNRLAKVGAPVAWTQLVDYRAGTGSFHGKEVACAQLVMRRFLSVRNTIDAANRLPDKVAAAFSIHGFEYTGLQLHRMVGFEYEWRSITAIMSRLRHSRDLHFTAGYDFGIYRNRPSLQYGNLGV